MRTVTLLYPASSPGDSSMISACILFRSAQRRYIRSSISAQSCESVPPAPAWMLTSAGLSAYGLAKSRSTSCFSTSVLRARRSCSSVSWRCPSSSAIAISARPMTSLARTSSFRQIWTSSRRPLDSWASRWARGGSCQTLGSASSRCSASRRWLFWGRSKMLLELQDLFQEVVRLVEDLFHGLLVSVTVLESLAAAAGADVVAPDAREIQRLRPAEWQPRGSGRAGASRLRRLGRLRHVLGPYWIRRGGRF